MPLIIENLPEAIRTTKQQLRAALPEYKEVFREVEAEMRRRVEEIVSERESGHDVIPIVQYKDLASGKVPAELIAKIRSRGACVVRGTFSSEVATGWDDEIAAYVERNDLDAKLANRAEDKYFGTLAAAKPQIYGIYWSRPQVEARQSEELTNVRVFLNNLWLAEHEGVRYINPSETPAYADRIRRRPPGSASLGLSPHVDGGSVERWLDREFPQGVPSRVYRRLAEVQCLCRRLPSPGAGSGIARGVFDVPHVSGLDSSHTPGAGRRNLATDSHRRVDGLRSAARHSRRCARR